MSLLDKTWTPKLLSCLRGGYTRRDFIADLIAGVTVGLVALPLAMAFGIASDPALKPHGARWNQRAPEAQRSAA